MRTDVEEMLIIDRALGQFLKAMRERLRAKMKEGFRGWDDPESCVDFVEAIHELSVDLLYASPTAGEVDLANFAMFLWWQQRERERKAKPEEDDR